MLVFLKLVAPFTDRLLLTITLLDGTTISPVPLALSSKSLLEIVVVITLSSINMLPVLNLLAVTLPVDKILPTLMAPVT